MEVIVAIVAAEMGLPVSLVGAALVGESAVEEWVGSVEGAALVVEAAALEGIGSKEGAALELEAVVVEGLARVEWAAVVMEVAAAALGVDTGRTSSPAPDLHAQLPANTAWH